MGEVLKKFGRYFLLDHIAQGGMAEIYRARLASPDGAGRLMVIKRIQAGFGANSEFLQMFKSEIKVTMGFNHPNIVQLYDFGEENKQPYIAMELVDGKNLRQFMTRFTEAKQSFPIELAVFVIEQAASGLHYAHSFKDKISGAPLNIVHRDISPQNILISYEGNVKVIDFGIAKATVNSEATRAGVIKGKPSYLSPEQISGDTLDGRSDIFALGAVLWEVLTGKKLFAGENDLAVLKLIESCQTHVRPPSTLNPKVPKELDYIVLKTLTKQREKRYQSTEELQRALHKFLYSFAPDFNPSDLSYYAKDLFKNEIVEDRKLIQKLNDKAESLLALQDNPDILENDSEGATTILGAGSPAKPPRKEHTSEYTIESLREELNTKVDLEVRPTPSPSPAPAPVAHTPPSTASHTPRPRPQVTGSQIKAPAQRQSSSQQGFLNPKNIAVIAAAGIALLAVFGPEYGIKVPVLSDLVGDLISGNDARLILTGNQKNVVVAINGQTVANALPATIGGVKVGAPFRLTVTGAGGGFQQELTLKKGEKMTVPVVLSPDQAGTLTPGSPTTASAPQAGKSVHLKLNLMPGGGNPTISLNGSPIGADNPSQLVTLDSPLELTIDRPGFKTFKREFVLESKQIGGLKEWLMDVQLEPLHPGHLSLRSTPSSDASIPLDDGPPWKKKTPLENEVLPAGTYNIRLTNEVLGMEKNVNVTIEEGKSVSLDVKLEIER